MRSFFITLSIVCFFASCKGKEKVKDPDPVEVKDTIQVVTVDPANDSMLRIRTQEVMQAFKSRNYTALAALVHPDSGVRFSPYSYVDSTSDRIVTAEWIRNNASKNESLTWGSQDGTGDDIKTTFAGYINRYVYDVDFVKPEKFEINNTIGASSTLNNLKEMYPTCNFTESYFPGFEKKYDGMDWRSLRLVFKLKDGIYYLIGVVHDEWTT